MRSTMCMLTSIAGLWTVLAFSASASAESPCARMLDGAPAQLKELEAVQSCTGRRAACAYMETTADFGVLTLMCPGVNQIIFANRLRSLQMRDGVLWGECTSGSWSTDFGLPGCYPAPWHPRLPAASE